MTKFGIALVPDNFDYDILDDNLSFRELKVIFLAGPFDSIKEASESIDAFHKENRKFGHEIMVINYNPKTMKEIEF